MNQSLTGWNKATVVWRGRANPTGNAALETIFSCTYIHPVYLFYVCGTWFSDCQRFKISSSTGWNTAAACLVRSNKSDWQVERGPPIVNASKMSSSTAWNKTTACSVRRNKSYWQLDMKPYPVALTSGNVLASFNTGFLHNHAGSDRGSIEVRSRSKRTPVATKIIAKWI